MARKTTKRELDLEAALGEVHAEAESLAQELREAVENAPESLQSSPANEAKGEAADALEGLSQPDVDDVLRFLKLEHVEFVRTPKQMAKLSRPARRDDAVSLLDAVVDFLQEVVDDSDPASHEEARKIKALEGKNSEELTAIHEAAENLRDEVENYKGELEAVEFPGR